jgi:predicted RNA-binding protein associated with RNAse of E/G family
VASTADEVRIRYHRLPDRLDVYTQQRIVQTDDGIVTLNENTRLRADLHAGNHVILEPGSPVVWFTFPGLWHDIGRFHLRDGTFTGFYANLLTPVRMLAPDEWETTDLFLDVWQDADGRVLLLDEEEFEQAIAAGWLDTDLATRARHEADAITGQAAAGGWPPPIVREWTLERVRRVLDRKP